MHTILARPFDDSEIVEVLLVEHKENKPVKKFEEDWDAAVAQAKKDNSGGGRYRFAHRPETWCVDEVITDLESYGWQIIRPTQTTVTY